MRRQIRYPLSTGIFIRNGIYLLILTAALALQFCDDEVTEPGPVSHDFVWEVDTLFQDTFQYLGLTIWGTSETNVYVGGHESDHGGRRSLFRYDGHTWSAIDLRRFGLVTIEAISGIDSSNFIVVGDGGKRGHAGRYRHGVWDTLRLPWLRPAVRGVHMVSPAEIYICGADGVLRHDGENYSWIVDSSRSVPTQSGGYAFWPRDIRKGRDGIVYFNSGYEGNGGTYVFRMTMFDADSCRVINESIYRTGREVLYTGQRLRNVGEYLLTGYNAAFSLSNGQYTLRHTIEGFLFVGTDVGGNLFALTMKQVKHFNGQSWSDITPGSISQSVDLFPIWDALYLDSTLFLVTQNGNKTLIYRGKHIK